MDPRLAQPTEMVAAHLAEWETPHVELAIFGSGDAAAIVRAVDELCARELGAGIARQIFYQSSVGSVSGVELVDGRRLVVKIHQPNVTRGELTELMRVQMHLASRNLYAPAVTAGPLPIGRGLATVEAFVDAGERRDGHHPATRRALAASLHRIVAACRPLAQSSSLPRHFFGLASAGEGAPLWPTPHSKLFDFAATAAGAEAIDDVARAARDAMAPSGDVVIAHCDWRVEHVKFARGGDEIVVAYDWDSLRVGYEAALVGLAAHAFAADWSQDVVPQAPTLDEARAFVADYEAARGASFTVDERSLCGASFAYSCAYTARCGHAVGDDDSGFIALVRLHGAGLLRW
jgi:hypothetical protein